MGKAFLIAFLKLLINIHKGNNMQIPPITALLPMKGTSERVPGKNIRLFGGEPLFYHILKTLENVKYIDRIIINTDSQKIKNLASSFPKVIFHDRPAEICGGHIPMNTIIDYDISHSDGEFFLQTHSTNPLLSSDTLQRALETFFMEMTEYDSLFSVSRIQQRLYDKNFTPLNHNPSVLQNTQELDPVFAENSCIYIFSRESFMKNGNNRLGLHPYAFEIPPQESYDIDTEDDFQIAEKIFIGNLHK